MAAGETKVTIDGQTHQLTGLDIRRTTNALVLYTKPGTRTGTNSYGTEVAVVAGKVTKVEIGVGNMLVPANGYVLSGHGTENTWLKARAQVGDDVTFNDNGGGGGSGGTPLLPDIGIRTLRQFTIARPTTGEFAGRKLLKFPGVTANVGDAALEIKGVRTSSSSGDWVAQQVVYNTDGSKTTLPPTAATFYYAGDGHTHWHIKDFDSYELLSADGSVLEEGEKHGFCFEDNTSYRDWPGSSKHPNSPAVGAYQPSNVCGVRQPQATQIMHGLSVGWSDTYPATLPDQAIDVTGVPDGEYTVKVTADWQHYWAEKNE